MYTIDVNRSIVTSFSRGIKSGQLQRQLTLRVKWIAYNVVPNNEIAPFIPTIFRAKWFTYESAFLYNVSGISSVSRMSNNVSGVPNKISGDRL